MPNSFQTRAEFNLGQNSLLIHRLDKLDRNYDINRLPYTHKILLENLLRNEDGENVQAKDIEALAQWNPEAKPSVEIAYTPARVILQDFTGVPAIVDLAAMRDAMQALGGKPNQINPLSPAELVIDHSVQVDVYNRPDALKRNSEIELERNRERYAFLRWGQKALDNFRVVPPDTGIVHQVNLEYLARVVFDREQNGERWAYPDTLVGTDSHTTMINGLGVLGWGVGGIEAEAAMLGQAISMLIPQVVGFELTGELSEGTTATDLVLTVTEMLRKHGVVGKFVEFFGDGLATLPLADRATLGNMSPEFGSTCAVFPIDEETLRYLRLTGRPEEHVLLVESYAKTQGLWRDDESHPGRYSSQLKLDLSSVEPSIAGPRRPQDRIKLNESKQTYRKEVAPMIERRAASAPNGSRFENEGGATAVGTTRTNTLGAIDVSVNDQQFTLKDGAIVIAAITSCTNTSNPAVLIGAGLLAKKAREKGLKTKPWVKTSLAPGSQVVTRYLEQAGLLKELTGLGFGLVGYGCTTCIGNSGPLLEPIHNAIQEADLVACAVLSGNRNFEGRIHPDVRMNFLASPPLVVAHALAGSMDVDLTKDPLGTDSKGELVYLKDIWPSQKEIHETLATVKAEMFREVYASVFEGDETWRSLPVPEGEIYSWDDESTYVRRPPFFEDIGTEVPPVKDIAGARVLALLGDSVTTDHISPAGSIASDSPAGRYLQERGVSPKDFNSYGSRRGNHEVMMRGTFANIRLRNQLVPGTEGGYTKFLPTGEQMSIYDAAMRYREQQIPLIVVAGKEYGTGSSRDWAAKGTLLLGVQAVIAESYERIHRSNLIGMGVLPLQFEEGKSAESLGLNGTEVYSVSGLDDGQAQKVNVKASAADGKITDFKAIVRLDTPKEKDYFRHGGILQYVLRQLARSAK